MLSHQYFRRYSSLLLLGCFAMPAFATIVNFSDFSDSSSLKLNGAAAIVNAQDGKVLRLTPAQDSQSGSAFSQKTLNASNFSTFFKFRITNPGGSIFDCNTQAGADGLVFVVQAVSESIGGSGAGIGYEGITKSVGVEFDTWCNGGNNDPSSNHLAIITDGSVVHAATPNTDVLNITPDFDDGNVWYAWVDYNGTILEVRTNQTGVRPDKATLSKTLDIPKHLGNVNQAFIGFTSGTGLDWGNHDIIAWEYRDSFSPIASVTNPNSCAATYNNGKLHIPSVLVSDGFGGSLNYQVDMSLIAPNPLTFSVTSATKQ